MTTAASAEASLATPLQRRATDLARLVDTTWDVLIVGGGVIVPMDKFSGGVRAVLQLLPVSALSDGLRDVLQHGAGMPWGDLGVLAVWAVVGLAAAGRFFRWE